MEHDPSVTEEEASRKARSLSPFLGWICCIAAVSGTLSGGHRVPRSWSCSEPDGEADILRRFWSDVAAVPASVVWVTFNGKRFDVPFLLARSLHYGIAPTQRRLLDRYPYRHRPHADLAWVWPRQCTLDGLCDHLGVASSKSTMTGADIAGAVGEGRIVEVARYCESDTIATLVCLQAMPCVLDL
jgi:3'-5' exonuclease